MPSIMSVVNRGLRTAARTLGQRAVTPASAARVLAPRLAVGVNSAPQSSQSVLNRPSASSALFSTSARRTSAPTMPQEGREYDPEIKDIASYVHNTPIDSDLAVS